MTNKLKRFVKLPRGALFGLRDRTRQMLPVTQPSATCGRKIQRFVIIPFISFLVLLISTCAILTNVEVISNYTKKVDWCVSVTWILVLCEVVQRGSLV